MHPPRQSLKHIDGSVESTKRCQKWKRQKKVKASEQRTREREGNEKDKHETECLLKSLLFMHKTVSNDGIKKWNAMHFTTFQLSMENERQRARERNEQNERGEYCDIRWWLMKSYSNYTDDDDDLRSVHRKFALKTTQIKCHKLIRNIYEEAHIACAGRNPTELSHISTLANHWNASNISFVCSFFDARTSP